jgi:hypothetical protein
MADTKQPVQPAPAAAAGEPKQVHNRAFFDGVSAKAAVDKLDAAFTGKGGFPAAVDAVKAYYTSRGHKFGADPSSLDLYLVAVENGIDWNEMLEGLAATAGK